MDKSALPYRPCVGIALFNAQGHVFVGERIDTPGAWQMPQGGIDEGEDLEVAARRELCEEIGTDSAELLKISEQTTRYDLPAHLLGRLWDG
ncbi:MAG: NUDIX domain-containing protein, partial [Alphaproteobacteria bacterium]|nr:NUDIX domain-containing protein [Alphaproteobacteria bacterium]